MTILDEPRTSTSSAVWTAPRWATYMDMEETDTRLDFDDLGTAHGTVSYYRDVSGASFFVDHKLTMDLKTLAVSIEPGEVQVRIHAGLGDNEHLFTIEDCRAQLARFQATPPVIQPLIDLRDALVSVLDVYDRSEAGETVATVEDES